MNLKTTILLLLLLIIVGGFYFFVDSQTPPASDATTSSTADRPGEALFLSDQFPTSSVQSVTMTRGDQVVKIVQEGTDWRQSEPVSFPLNSWSAKQVADDAAELRFVEKVKAGARGDLSAKEAGLDPPLATVAVTFQTIGSTTAEPQKIRLGKRMPLGGRGYVQINDDPTIYVVNDDLHQQVLDKKIADLRKKSFDPPSEGKAQRVALSHAGSDLDLVKADGQWSLGPPHSGRADEQKVKDLLSDVGGMYINDFTTDEPESLAVYGLDRPTTLVRIETASQDDAEAEPAASGELEILRIGFPVNFKKEHFFASCSRTEEPSRVVFTVPKSFADKFDKSVDSLRDPRITPIKRGDIREISVERRDGTSYQLVHSEATWSFAEPGPGFEADQNQAGELLDELVNAKAVSYRPHIDPEAEPDAEVTLISIGQPQPDVLKVFPANRQSSRLVLRNNETTGYLVPADGLQRLFDSALALRNRTVLDLPAGQLSQVVIQHPDGRTYQLERKFEQESPGAAEPETTPDGEPADAEPVQPGPWQLAGHDRYESEDFADLLGHLNPLTAEEWHDEPQQLASPIELTMVVLEGEKTMITVDPISRFATIRSAGPEDMEIDGFKVSASLVEELGQELRYRTVVELAVSDIRKVVVRRAGTELTIFKDNDDTYSTADGPRLDQTAAGSLFDTLAGLKAKHFMGPVKLKNPIRFEVHRKGAEALQLSIDRAQGLGSIVPDMAFKLSEDDIAKLTEDLTEPMVK